MNHAGWHDSAQWPSAEHPRPLELALDVTRWSAGEEPAACCRAGAHALIIHGVLVYEHLHAPHSQRLAALGVHALAALPSAHDRGTQNEASIRSAFAGRHLSGRWRNSKVRNLDLLRTSPENKRHFRISRLQPSQSGCLLSMIQSSTVAELDVKAFASSSAKPPQSKEKTHQHTLSALLQQPSLESESCRKHKLCPLRRHPVLP